MPSPEIASFFSAPRFSAARISPDGAAIAYLSPWERKLNVFVVGSKEAKDCLVSDGRVTASEHRSIEDFCWSPDSARILFVQDVCGDENWHLHSAAVAIDRPEPVDLTPFPRTGSRNSPSHRISPKR